MSSSSLSTAIIPYTPPVSTMDFISAEVEKGISRGTIKPHQPNSNLSIPRPRSLDWININLSNLSEILGTPTYTDFSRRSVKRLPTIDFMRASPSRDGAVILAANSDLSSPKKKLNSSVSYQKTGESVTSRKGSQVGDLGSKSPNKSILTRSGSVISSSSGITRDGGLLVTFDAFTFEGLNFDRTSRAAIPAEEISRENPNASLRKFSSETDSSDSREVLSRATEGALAGIAASRVSSTSKVNGKEIAEVLQSEAGFTISSDKKPIVATYACSDCVAMGGYDATNGIAFVVHFANPGEVRDCGGLVFYNISKLVNKKIESPIQLHLRGGVEGRSEETIKAIKIWMKQRKDLPMEIASEDILGSGLLFDSKSLSIDSRDGSVSDYDPLSNSESRGMSKLEVMSAIISYFMPNLKVAYTPNGNSR